MKKNVVMWMVLLFVLISLSMTAIAACDCDFESDCGEGYFCWISGDCGMGFDGECNECPSVGSPCPGVEDFCNGCGDDLECDDYVCCPPEGCPPENPPEFSSYGWTFLVIGMVAVSFFLIRKRL